MGRKSMQYLRLIFLLGLILFISTACQQQNKVLKPTNPLIPMPTRNNTHYPKIGNSFSIQFSGDINPDMLTGDVIDLDLFETEPALIHTLQSQGKLVVCYISAGSWEDWRPDADNYPEMILGKNYSGWPGERWVDIRETESLRPILENRFDLCAAKGFDGVETDNMDSYQNQTGFFITAKDQLTFNRWLAKQAHQRNLFIGLKNNPDQAAVLVNDFDFILAESCFSEEECEAYLPFIKNKKPVFVLEYNDNNPDLELFCNKANDYGFYLSLKNRELDDVTESCP